MSVQWMTVGGDIDREVLVDEIKEYLSTMRVTLWGKQSTITEEKGRVDMAEWLADVLNDLVQFKPDPEGVGS